MSIGFPTFTPTVHRDSSGACPWPQSSTYIRSTPFPLDCAEPVLARKTTATAATMTLTLFMGRPPSFNAKRVFGNTEFSLCGFSLGLAHLEKPHRLKAVLVVRPPRAVRITTVAIARHVFRQSFSGNLDPHSRRVTDGPTVFAVRLGLIAAPHQFGLYRGLIVILNRGREVSDVGLMFRVLALAEV